jgi:hypothetical protein
MKGGGNKGRGLNRSLDIITPPRASLSWRDCDQLRIATMGIGIVLQVIQLRHPNLRIHRYGVQDSSYFEKTKHLLVVRHKCRIQHQRISYDRSIHNGFK